MKWMLERAARSKYSESRVRTAVANSSVNVYVVGLDLDRQKRNPLLLQCVMLPSDILLIVWGGQAGTQPGQASLHLAEFGTPISRHVTSFLCLQVTSARIIQVQVRAGDPMLVLVDPVDSAHEHESHASGRAQPVLQRSPVWFHLASPFIAGVAVGSPLDCWPGYTVR